MAKCPLDTLYEPTVKAKALYVRQLVCNGIAIVPFIIQYDGISMKYQMNQKQEANVRTSIWSSIQFNQSQYIDFVYIKSWNFS